MEEIVQNGKKMIYCPAIAIDSITVHHTFGKLGVTPFGFPERQCGIARRVGYTDGSDTALALYRLKIKMQGQRIYITLPSLFVVVGGIFLDYDHWFVQQGQGEAASEESHDTSANHKNNNTFIETMSQCNAFYYLNILHLLQRMVPCYHLPIKKP